MSPPHVSGELHNCASRSTLGDGHGTTAAVSGDTGGDEVVVVAYRYVGGVCGAGSRRANGKFSRYRTGGGRRPRPAGSFGLKLGDARNVRARTRGTARAHLGGGGAQGVYRTYSDWDG